MKQSLSERRPESSPIQSDLLIIGGGLTGLSLACWLEQTARSTGQAMPSVSIIEPRARYLNDRTWCFWEREAHPFDELVSHRWPRWRVCAKELSVTQEGRSQCYAMLSAEAVYRKACTTISMSPQLDLYPQSSAEQIIVRNDSVLVSGSGRHWQAKAVVDTRPPEPAQIPTQEGLWQLFTGFEVDCPDHGYALDTAWLMDFQPDIEKISFIYLLPLGPDRLLVEWTEFQAELQTPAFESVLCEWLDRNMKRPYSLGRREAGALPMMEISNHLAPGRLVNAGIRGGWMRSSSGYHFTACQRGCSRLATQILNAHQSGQWLLQTPQLRHFGLRWMDRVFLKALRRHPQQAQSWFLAMFARTNAAQMSRFMNDQPGIMDILAVVRALPAGPLIKAALR